MPCPVKIRVHPINCYNYVASGMSLPGALNEQLGNKIFGLIRNIIIALIWVCPWKLILSCGYVLKSLSIIIPKEWRAASESVHTGGNMKLGMYSKRVHLQAESDHSNCPIINEVTEYISTSYMVSIAFRLTTYLLHMSQGHSLALQELGEVNNKYDTF